MSRVMDQNFVDEPTPRISVQTIHEKDLSPETLDAFFSSSPPSQSIGLSPAYCSGSLNALAIAITSSVLLIQFSSSKWKREGKRNPANHSQIRIDNGRKLLEDRVLCRSYGNVVGFDLAPLALVLYSDHGLRLSNGVDIQSCCYPKNRHPLMSIKAAAADIDVYDDNIIYAFRNMEHDQSDTRDLALRAWISHYITQLAGMEERFEKAPKINTLAFTELEIGVLSQIAHNGLRLDLKKTQVTEHSASSKWDKGRSQFRVQSDEFKNRVRRNGVDQNMKLGVQGPNGSYVVKAQAGNVLGKMTTVTALGNHEGKVIQSISTIGQEGHTSAEAQRASVILRILQGNKELMTVNPWIQNIWLSSESMVWPEKWKSLKSSKSISKIERPLNDSQLAAVQSMLSSEDADRIVLIQGPPGTGKTSVISCFVEEAIKAGYKGLWLVAQSNVAVKNIAEKLAANDFWKWKLIVSQDFRFQWHEHLYQCIQNNVIQSNTLKFLRPRQFDGCQVILCTLAMLSSSLIQKVAGLIPINTLVVDEASQIEIGDYMPAFTRYSTVRKACFIGDDKQLPPHGQEDIPDLQSIFELTNLRRLVLFLDTQYRMPPQIGDFISAAVYDDKLSSNPLHPVPNSIRACHFIDVADGKEQMHGTSWMNSSERKAVLTIARHLESQERQYRIITPYEAQRNLIEEDMKAEDLEWGDKVFNVDSFQGNEEDYIIISLVRSRELGFLKNLRRTNVMLTRCKRGMFICSSRAFLTGPQGSESLAGKMLEHMGEESWLDLDSLENLSL